MMLNWNRGRIVTAIYGDKAQVAIGDGFWYRIERNGDRNFTITVGVSGTGMKVIRKNCETISACKKIAEDHAAKHAN